jgi:hypothetical protein
MQSRHCAYDDLRRFGPDERELLEASVAQHGVRLLPGLNLKRVTVDVDTTVMPLFGQQEGALPGPMLLPAATQSSRCALIPSGIAPRCCPQSIEKAPSSW